ncbi:DUF7095 family protein [Natronobacterium gregoryi]|uniref:Uncharacterized protein n=2 Tax=Natronobacterium gregoryi TaxID=44930 RepID=L0AIQ4_NATGS|nr:hypothetical protein [Natronobacterium gregoryi]AFZ73666.1 hypothetical protein Natgr_2502 [Natronobacterium gregoryi SP2]ELY67859.1 hypothetical protein C490_10635 [Natronobacterium gregoryi SP2]PLK19609.1 hypothetical protein CYV19_13860 [Natronobacterium gregoryi SP2]SFJ00589.1 hypothetical protein SAMN05443661_11131 [Natronobacterium gregoryi]
MSGFDRADAVDRLEAVVDTVEDERMPVPVREVWAFGDVALGLDPVERLDVYLTKDVLVRDDSAGGADDDPDVGFRESHGIEGVGKSVRADWAAEYSKYLRANAAGHAAPEKCLAAHLLGEDDSDPVHLEVCNASFEDNVTQRLRGAQLRDEYTQLLDPRGVCLWADGVRSDEAFRKLRESELALPTLSDALEMLGMDDDEATEAAQELHAWREDQEGVTVRGDVV